ncbi:MAG TPA: hypothetical protein VF139_12535 [Candidatus Polarisedimenticolaceae bacterium]
MKVVRNKTRTPLRVPLGRGRFLHLGPGQTGQVGDDAPEVPALKRMVKLKKLELLGDEDEAFETAAAGGPPREFAQGHAQPTRIFPKGNRGG